MGSLRQLRRESKREVHTLLFAVENHGFSCTNQVSSKYLEILWLEKNEYKIHIYLDLLNKKYLINHDGDQVKGFWRSLSEMGNIVNTLFNLHSLR